MIQERFLDRASIAGIDPVAHLAPAPAPPASAYSHNSGQRFANGICANYWSGVFLATNGSPLGRKCSCSQGEVFRAPTFRQGACVVIFTLWKAEWISPRRGRRPQQPVALT